MPAPTHGTSKRTATRSARRIASLHPRGGLATCLHLDLTHVVHLFCQVLLQVVDLVYIPEADTATGKLTRMLVPAAACTTLAQGGGRGAQLLLDLLHCPEAQLLGHERVLCHLRALQHHNLRGAAQY